jgi:nitrosocyanin
VIELKTILVILTLVFVAACAPDGTLIPANETVPDDSPADPDLNITTPAVNISDVVLEKQDKTFYILARNYAFEPDTIRVDEGDTVKLVIQSVDVEHGFSLPAFGIDEILRPGEEITVEFLADKKGDYEFNCSVYCGQGHTQMRGRFVVQ